MVKHFLVAGIALTKPQHKGYTVNVSDTTIQNPILLYYTTELNDGTLFYENCYGAVLVITPYGDYTTLSEIKESYAAKDEKYTECYNNIESITDGRIDWVATLSLYSPVSYDYAHTCLENDVQFKSYINACMVYQTCNILSCNKSSALTTYGIIRSYQNAIDTLLSVREPGILLTNNKEIEETTQLYESWNIKEHINKTLDILSSRIKNVEKYLQYAPHTTHDIATITISYISYLISINALKSALNMEQTIILNVLYCLGSGALLYGLTSTLIKDIKYRIDKYNLDKKP